MCSLHCQKFERKRKKRMFLNFYCLNILAGAKILSDLKHRTQYNIVFSVKFISRLHQVGMFLFFQVNPIFPWRGFIYIFLSTVSLNEAWNKFVYFLWKQLNKQKRNWNSSIYRYTFCHLSDSVRNFKKSGKVSKVKSTKYVGKLQKVRRDANIGYAFENF